MKMTILSEEDHIWSRGPDICIQFECSPYYHILIVVNFDTVDVTTVLLLDIQRILCISTSDVIMDLDRSNILRNFSFICKFSDNYFFLLEIFFTSDAKL